MITPQAEIDQIRGKMRRRVLELPVKHEGIRRPARHPKTGYALSPNGARGGSAVRPCPMRKGGVYTLKPRIPYDQYRAEAGEQPSRARATIALIDKCETPTRMVTITVTHPPVRQGDKWLVRFEKGDHADQFDRPIFLSKYGDYTMSASKQAIPGDPEVMMPFAEDLANARAKARERRVSPQRVGIQRATNEMETLREAMTNMKAAILLKRAQRCLEAADRLLSAEAIHSESSAAADGSQGEADRPPRGAPLASLESAA